MESEWSRSFESPDEVIEDPKVLDVRLRPHTRQCLNLQALMSDESEAHGHGEDGQESEENRGPNNT